MRVGTRFLPCEAGEGDRPQAGGGGNREAMRAPQSTIAAARHLRRSLSAPEAMLWSRLRNRTAGTPAFRRQHPVGPYVVDFYCAKAQLAVEIDGSAHGLGDRPQRDQRRDAYLEASGMTVVRISAKDVIAAVGIVRMAAALIEAQGARPFHRPPGGPPPPLRRGG